MAKVNSLQWEGSGYVLSKEFPCSFCGKDKGYGAYRLFYYPTFMNGDAEEMATLCAKHYKDNKKGLYKDAQERLTTDNSESR